MALSTAGYDGTINALQWATIAALFGRSAVVGAAADYAPTADGARGVSLAAGDAYQSGNKVTSDIATVVTPSPVPGAGVGQWFAIVIERNTATSATALTFRAGPSTSATTPTTAPASLPVTLKTNRGVLEDQILCWLWINGTNTTTVLIDVREVVPTLGRTGVFAASTMQRDAKMLGSLVSGATVIRTDLSDAVERFNGTAWKLFDTAWQSPTLGSGWTNESGNPLQYRLKGGIVLNRGRASSTGATGVAFTYAAGYLPDTPAGQPFTFIVDAAGPERMNLTSGGAMTMLGSGSKTAACFGTVSFVAAS